MSSGAFALFIDLKTDLVGSESLKAVRAIPFPTAANVRFSLLCGAAEDMRIGTGEASILFIDANANLVGTPLRGIHITPGYFVPPTPVLSGGAAFVEFEFLNPQEGLAPITALVQFD
jgi:hypothetical protein